MPTWNISAGLAEDVARMAQGNLAQATTGGTRTLNLPGLPPMTITEAHYQDLIARGVIPKPPTAAPAPTARTATAPAPTLGLRKRPTGATSTPSGLDPCAMFEKVKLSGQKAVILNAHKARCEAWKEAQAFATSPAEMIAEPTEVMNEEPASGMSTGVKIALAAGGVLLLGGIAWYVMRR